MPDIQDYIILKFKQGDRDAFNVIYLHYRNQIVTFCKYLVPIEDAEEITADIFVRLWRSRDQWENIRNVKAFLYISARNACYNYLRSEKTKPRKEFVPERWESEPQFILQSEIESDLLNLIKREIDKLPDTCKTVFKMAFFDGYENREIASELELSYQTVANLKTIGLDTIKKNLKNRGVQINAILLLLQISKCLT